MTTQLLSAPAPAPAPTLASLAAATKGDRNRAIDFYRVVAMLFVAFGHWLALVAVTDGATGDVVGGNAIEFVPGLGWLSWVMQVMPLFFVVGGFSSAVSLDSHDRNGGSAADWIAARLRRMLPPAVVLAGTWLVLISAGLAIGQASITALALQASAVPLWFLANYTIDTALAPFVLPRFRQNPRLVAGALVSAFGFFELLRIADVPYLPHVNWVLGWLIFQVMGMAWRDGLLPTGRNLVAAATTMWAATLALVLSGGPWTITMVNVAGIENSPTVPPTLSLLAFGTAYSLTAVAFAPRISAALTARPAAWAAVVGANTVAMSVYLWHMTAAVIVAAAMHFSVGLPEHVVGSADWWFFKIPTVLLSMIVLAPIVAVVSKIERKALLAPRRPWVGGLPSIVAVAIVTSTALKLWSAGELATAVPSLAVLVVLGVTVLRPTPVKL